MTVLINRATVVGGKTVIGAPLKVAGGPFRGNGTISGAARVNAVFELIDGLPIVDQVRLSWNRYAGVLLRHDIDGDGSIENFFLTVRFPPKRYTRKRTNPLTGVAEILVYENGVWRGSIDARQIVEIDVNESYLESGSRIYANRGTLEQPVRTNVPIEQTKTLEVWHRDWSSPGADPVEPVLAKLRINYVTGKVTREVFGMYSRPVETVDRRFITRYFYNQRGILKSGVMLENGREEGDFQRPLPGAVTEPIEGEKRYELEVEPVLDDFGSLADAGFRMIVKRLDLLKKQTQFIEYDLPNGGRIAALRQEAELNGTKLWLEKANTYDAAFHSGQVPRSATVRVRGKETILETLKTESYNPLQQRMVARSADYTGAEAVKTWLPDWESPVIVASGGRLTHTTFDRREMSFEATTEDSGGVEIIGTSGTFEPEVGLWTLQRRLWFKPEIPLRSELVKLSASGLPLTIVDGDLTTSIAYSDDGIESNRRISHGGDVVREEDGFKWESGTRTIQVTTFIDGQVYETFSSQTDPLGRLSVDREKVHEGIVLRTVLRYDGESERVKQVKLFQEETLREVQEPGVPEQGEDGTWLLPVVSKPTWGRGATAYFALGTGSNLPVKTVREDGKVDKVWKRSPGLGSRGLSAALEKAGR